MHRRHFLILIPAAIPAAGVLTSCGGSRHQKTRLALDWKPEPEFGGFYAADYGKHGLDVDILPGGAGTPTVQMVGAGSAEFGIVAADQLIVARAQGNDAVALFAVYQTTPLAIMVHASRGLTSLSDLFKQGGTLAIQKGLPFARLLEKQYGFGKMKIVPSTGGDITPFLRDPDFAMQCYATSEPLAAKRLGADPQTFLISEIGYNPYVTVLATSSDLLRKQPERAKAMVAAVREGWRTYLDNPKPANQEMNQLNPTMAPDVFAEVAEVQKQFIETPETRANGLGIMSAQRWQTLISQLTDLGDVHAPIRPEDCFRIF